MRVMPGLDSVPDPGEFVAELRRQRKLLEVQLGSGGSPTPRRRSREDEPCLTQLLSTLRRELQKPSQASFPQQLLAAPLDGLGLLLDLLKLVQLCQANTGQKGPSQAVFKRALGDEHELLGCIKESVTSQVGLERLAHHASGLFTVSVCVMSNFSKSRVLSLQVLARMCSLPAGHRMVADAISMLRLRFGEPVRFKFIVGMLCSYNSGSFQLSCLRFLNTFLETAASLEERVYIQEELRLAGLDDFDLESLGQQAGIRDESLKEETARWHRNHIDLTALVGESQNLRQQLESARREVEQLQERCRKMEAERQELVTRNGNVAKVGDDNRELTSERKQDEESDGRSSTPRPDYPTSPVTAGTLGEKDMAKGEEVVVQALTISVDTFRQRYQQHPPPTSTADGNWHLKESNGHYAKSRHSSKTHFQKSERKLPKTPDPGRRKELVWSSEQFEQMLGESPKLKEKEDEGRVGGQHYNTMETVSTRSFGFSRPSGSFVRRERERRLAQHRAQFVLQETSLGGQKMVHYRKSGNRTRGEEKTPSLARSKSMDMVAMANRSDEGKRRVLRASSVSRVDDEERDWREQTPFLSPRRNGRRGDRTSWGLDDQGPIFEVASTAQRPTHMEAINPAMTGQQRRSGKWKRTTSPPPPVPTPDYPDPPPSSRLS